MARPLPTSTQHNTNMRFVPVTVSNQAPEYIPAPVYGPAPAYGPAHARGYPSEYVHHPGQGYGTNYTNVPGYGPPPGYGHAPGYDVRLDSGSAVRNTVRNMVGNLEHVITNLHGIVGDLRVLVQQIDVVTNKIGGQYGVYWEKSGLNHVSTTQEKVSKGKDMDSFGLYKWKLLREKYDSADFSPDIDWSYLGLSECNNKSPAKKSAKSAKKFARKLRHTNHIDTSADSLCSNGCDIEHNDDFRIDTGSDLIANKASKRTFDSSSEINFDCLEIDGHSSDLDCDWKRSSLTSRNGSLNPPVPQHAFCKDITGSDCAQEPYCGVYESIMESKLETLSNCDANSTFSDGEEELLPVTEDPPSVTSLDFKAEYDRHVNPWKSFGFVQIDSTQGSDEILSESASDILNDNYLETHYINPGFDDVHAMIQQTIC